jgi:hypothetical protein
VSAFTLERLKQAMVEAGLEIYRFSGSEIRVAERVRVHLMDSGVAVAIHSGAAAGDQPRVAVTVRSQRSDFPSTSADTLFAKVREAVLPAARARGFEEAGAAARDITDPVDASHVLDVWHELTFTKPIDGIPGMIEDVRWALSVPKCVDR